MGIFNNSLMTVKRAGSVITSIPAFPAQVDLMSQVEASYYGGAAPYQRYRIFTTGTYDIRQEDLLTDSLHIDPKTNAAKQYRVVNDPDTELFQTHNEIVADRYRGT
jgi:hypothetical protein